MDIKPKKQTTELTYKYTLYAYIFVTKCIIQYYKMTQRYFIKLICKVIFHRFKFYLITLFKLNNQYQKMYIYIEKLTLDTKIFKLANMEKIVRGKKLIPMSQFHGLFYDSLILLMKFKPKC